jgi:NADH:ubiquinone oxidoreductase subunit 4 (subunit M)
VFIGDYNEHDWHDMSPIRPIDKIVLIMFCLILVAIGVFPGVIVPIVEAGVQPVMNRITDAQTTFTVLDSMQTIATNVLQLFGGA